MGNAGQRLADEKEMLASIQAHKPTDESAGLVIIIVLFLATGLLQRFAGFLNQENQED